jgi:hypothetical protein
MPKEPKPKKPKIKTSLLDTKCVEDADHKGVWTFEAGRNKWRWENREGLNTYLVQGEQAQPMLYFAKLDFAVAYAWGYDAALDLADTTERDEEAE